MEKVIAVVVTYNRLTLLKECIAALKAQTRPLDNILVVNNGSTDETSQWLLKQADLLVITQHNLGSGGGFEAGIKWAYKNNYSWIWCMDDDGYPREDALEKILEPNLGSLCLRNCAVVNKDDHRKFVWKTGSYKRIDQVREPIIRGAGHPFNGTLIHRNIVERVGLPRKNLFMWGDESEYYYRITLRNNIPVCTITESVHYHPAAAFSYKKDWDYEHTWKIYFYIRNRFHINRTRFNNKLIAAASYSLFLLAMIGVILVYQKTDKTKKLGFMLWPAFDAFRNDFSANPAIILSRLSDKAGFNSITGWNIRNYLSHFFQSNIRTGLKKVTG